MAPSRGTTPTASRHAVGIDVGTSAVKVTVLTEDGRTHTVASDSYPLHSPSVGAAEQNPDDWWRAVGQALDEVLELFPASNGENTIVGLTGQMHTSVLRDEAGNVVRPAMLWCDSRAAAECAALKAARPEWERLTGYYPIPAFTSAHLAWLSQHEPETIRRTATLAVPKDDIRQRLGAGRATEPSDASGMNLMESGSDRWAQSLVEAVGLPLDALAPIVPSGAVTGYVTELPPTKRASALLGAPVIGGAGDQAAQAIALGVINVGQLGISVGTSGVAFQAIPAPRQGAFRHALPGLWLALDSTHAAGLAIAWWAGVNKLDYSEFPTTPPAESAPLFLPYLQGGRNHAGPPGTLVNLRASHTGADIAGAVLEGVAIELIRMARGITGGELGDFPIGTGGRAAAMPVIRSLIAAGLNRPVTHSSRGSSFGAAALAANTAGWFDLAALGVEDGASVAVPDAALAAGLARRMAAFEHFFERLG